MTVAELIQELQWYPEGATVVLEHAETSTDEVADLKLLNLRNPKSVYERLMRRQYQGYEQILVIGEKERLPF